jgi:hypothetical protein
MSKEKGKRKKEKGRGRLPFAFCRLPVALQGGGA